MQPSLYSFKPFAITHNTIQQAIAPYTSAQNSVALLTLSSVLYCSPYFVNFYCASGSNDNYAICSQIYSAGSTECCRYLSTIVFPPSHLGFSAILTLKSCYFRGPFLQQFLPVEFRAHQDSWVRLNSMLMIGLILQAKIKLDH